MHPLRLGQRVAPPLHDVLSDRDPSIQDAGRCRVYEPLSGSTAGALWPSEAAFREASGDAESFSFMRLLSGTGQASRAAALT